MDKVINQNDLVDVIKSAAENSVVLIDMINDVSTKINNLTPIDKTSEQKLKSSIKYLNNCLEDIISFANKISNNELSDKLINSSNNFKNIVSNISSTFNDISKMDIELSNLFKFQITIWQYNQLLNSIKKLFPENKQTILSKEHTNSILETGKVLSGVANDIANFYNELSPIIKKFKNINNNLIDVIIGLYYGDNNNPGIMLTIQKQLLEFDENKLTYISNTSKNIEEICKTFKETVSHIDIIMTEINKLKWVDKFISKEKNPFIPVKMFIDLLLDVISVLNKRLSRRKFDTVKLKKLSKYIKELKILLKTIKGSTTSIVALGLLFPVMILAVPLALGTIAMVKLFLNSIIWLLMTVPASVIMVKMLKNLTNSVLMIALSMLAVATTLVIAALTGPIITENVGRTALTMLAVLGMVALIGVVLWLAIKARIFTMAIKGTGQLMLAVLVICGSILAVAGTILLTSLIADTVVNNINPFLKMFGVTMLIVASAVAIALVAAAIAAPVFIGLAAIGLTVLGLMGITLLISELAKPKYDVSQHEDAIKKNVKSIKDIISTILTTLLNGGLLGNNNNERNRGLIGTILNFVSPSLYSLYEIIITFAFLSTTLLSVGALILIGNLLGKVASIEIEPTSIKNKIQDIVGCVHDLMKAVTAPYELKPGDKGLLGSLINWLAPELGHVIDAASSMMVLGLSVVSVGALKMIANSLSSIQNISLDKSILVGSNGKGGKVKEIMDTAGAVIKAISYQDSEKKSVYRQAKKKVKTIKNIVENLTKINEFLSEIYANNITYTANTLPGAISLISSDKFKQAIIDIANNKGLNRDTVIKSGYYKSIIKNIYGQLPDFTLDDKLAKNSIDVTNKYIEFIGKIDKVNLEKLQTSVKMFEKMADFSKSINGNFEKLAESINEELMPVLEELKETLNKIPEKIDTNAASVSASVAAYSSPMTGPSTSQGMTAQVNRENPGMSPEEVKKVVDNRLNEQARAQAQSLESKFDELIELLKSGMARVSLT